MWLVDQVNVETLRDRRGRVRVDRLPRTLRRRDVSFGELLDEELVACLADAAGDDPHWTPSLQPMSAAERDTARAVVARHQQALSERGAPGDPPELTTARFRLLPELGARAVRQLTWVHRDHHGYEGRGALLLLDDGTALQSDIDPLEGTHLLALRSADRVRTLVGALLDVRTEHADEGPHPDVGTSADGDVEAAAVLRCDLRRSAPWASRRPDRQLTTVATEDDALWLRDGDAGPVRIDGPRTRTMADELLAT